jgi:Prokaryotic cytochrome b561/Oxidoreductase molybdopterin binding domain
MVMSETASRGVVYRHSLVVRLWHWVSALSVAILLLTGLYIFNMHPALYWGEDGHEGIPTFLAVKMTGLDTTHPTSTLQIGSHVFNTTGLLGHAFGPPGKQRPWFAFHPIMVFPLPGHLGDARGWHFLMAWVLVVGSLIYVGYGFATGHFRRNFVPTVAQLRPRAIWSEIWNHLTFNYYESLDLFDAFHPQTILAYAMNGHDLPIKHGAPVRLRAELHIGYKNAKFVDRLEVVDSVAGIGRGHGSIWADYGYQWFAGL